MSELYEFIKKRSANFSDTSYRKLYGLNSIYLGNLPFIVISSTEQIVVKVDDFETRKVILKVPHVIEWVLDDKLMENWLLLPDTFNKKKNKLSPVLEMAYKSFLHPKKEKKVKKKKSKTRGKTIKQEVVVSDEKSPSILRRFITFVSR